MTKKVAIWGAGGHARVIVSIVRLNEQNDQLMLGVFDDSFTGDLELIQGVPLLGTFNDIIKYKEQIESFFIALGDNVARSTAYNFLQKNGFKLPPLIHPKTFIERDAIIENATVVCMGAQLTPEVKIGKGCILNTGCSVDHESIIGNFVHLAPQAVIAGRTTIGDYTFVGMNACIGDKLTIGTNVIIGAGSTVLRDVPDNTKVLGFYK